MTGMFSLTVEPELRVRDMFWMQSVSALTLTTKTEPAQRPGISAPARSLQMLIVRRVQKPIARRVITIEAAVGRFAHSVKICINNWAGLFFVITSSLEMVIWHSLCTHRALALKFKPDYAVPYIWHLSSPSEALTWFGLHLAVDLASSTRVKAVRAYYWSLWFGLSDCFKRFNHWSSVV